MSDWLRHGRRKARKEHKCDICGLPIKTGESYWHGTYVDVGIDEIHRHTWCEREVDWFYDACELRYDDDFDQWWVSEFVQEEIESHGHEYVENRRAVKEAAE